MHLHDVDVVHDVIHVCVALRVQVPAAAVGSAAGIRRGRRRCQEATSRLRGGRNAPRPRAVGSRTRLTKDTLLAVVNEPPVGSDQQNNLPLLGPNAIVYKI